MIRNTPNLGLAVIFEPDASRTDVLRARYQVPVYTDTAEFFQSGFDAGVLTSPASNHYRNVEEAVKYGKHVYAKNRCPWTDKLRRK